MNFNKNKNKNRGPKLVWLTRPPNAFSRLCKAKPTCYLLDPRSKAGEHKLEARRVCVSCWEVHFVLTSSQDSLGSKWFFGKWGNSLEFCFLARRKTKINERIIALSASQVPLTAETGCFSPMRNVQLCPFYSLNFKAVCLVPDPRFWATNSKVTY